MHAPESKDMTSEATSRRQTPVLIGSRAGPAALEDTLGGAERAPVHSRWVNELDVACVPRCADRHAISAWPSRETSLFFWNSPKVMSRAGPVFGWKVKSFMVTACIEGGSSPRSTACDRN